MDIPELETPVTETPIEQPIEDIEPVEAVTDDAILDAETVEAVEPVEGETVDEVAPDGVDADISEPAPLVFDETLDTPAFMAQVDDVLNKYDLSESPEITAVIDALKAKANAIPDDPLEAYKVYGDKESITTLLDRQSLIDSTRVENGQYRPRTDEFVKTLPAKTAEHLYFDLATSPSEQYKGLSKVQESIIARYGKENEPIGAVMERWDLFDRVMTTGNVGSDIPEFIPSQLTEAYYLLSKQSRDELSLLDPTWEDEDGKKPDAIAIEERVNNLKLIQKGIDSDKRDQANSQKSQTQQAQQFTADVVDTQIKFFDTIRNSFTDDMVKTVTFSSDPKLQSLYAKQQVTLLLQACEDGSSGEFARQAISDAGITFDYTQIQKLMAETEQAATDLNIQKRIVDDNGNPINKIELNKAVARFESVGKSFRAIQKSVLDQLAKVASTGKAEDVKAAVAKIKPKVQARVGLNGVASSGKKQSNAFEAYAPGDPRRYVDLFAA